MKKKITYILALLLSVAGLGVCANVQHTDTSLLSAVTSAPPAQTKPVTDIQPNKEVKTVQSKQVTIDYVDPIIVVKNPNFYLNKRVTSVARFDKFATLGLDYKPAYKSSETYISFLIFRSDTDKNIPLPEMKLFIKRTSAEKLVDLKEGDKVQFSGIVFSNALGDVWVDVDELKKIEN